MLKLARWSTTHRWYVLLGWLALLLIVNAVAQSAGTSYSNNFTLPNSGAQRAADLLQRSFPAQAGDRDTIVYKVSSGTVLDQAVRSRMSATFAEVAKLPHVAGVISPYGGGAGGKAISANGQIAFATVVFDKKANLLPKSAPERVVHVARAAARPGLEVELGGQAIEMTQQAGFGISTAVGLMAAIVVLLLTFGSLVAMGLPIVTALFGLGTGLGAIALFTHVVDTPNFSSELAAMIGLGVGIDYSLFILTRFREAYATPGPTFGDARESVLQSMDTAGRAVLFAGCTVVIALLGMMLLGVSFLYGVAISASIGVLLVMLASLTLLPALLTFAGKRLARPSRRARARARRSEASRGELGGRIHGGVGAERKRSGTGIAGGDRGAIRRRRMGALERLRAAPAVDDRNGIGAGDAGDRRSRHRAAARLERRRQRPLQPDHSPRLRAARTGLRQGLQRTAAGRREDPDPSECDPGRRPARGDRADARRRRGRPGEDQPRRGRGDDQRLSALLATGLRDHAARVSDCAARWFRRSRRARA